MSSDIGLGVVGVPNVGGVSKKPPHLVELMEGKNKNYFLALDKPELLLGFIQVKGTFLSSTEVERALKDISAFVTQVPKENIFEMLLPSHRVLSIKNLLFKAK
jgi:hypothetical protein